MSCAPRSVIQSHQPSEMMTSTEDTKYCQGIADDALQRAEALAAALDPDTEPYKSKYEAAEVLLAAVDAIKQRCGDTGAAELMAVMQVTRGIVLLDTDMLSAGQRAIEDHLPVLEETVNHTGAGSGNRVLLARAYNSLGALFYSRSLFQDAIAKLCQAESLLASCVTAADDDLTQDTHTQTKFYLAQAYTAGGQHDQAALYCAETMSRQLKTGKYQLQDWVRNALRLSAYFIDHGNFGIAEYCMRAADTLIQRDATPTTSNLSEEDQAMVNKAWGNIYLQKLVQSFRKNVDGVEEEEGAEASSSSTVQFVEFPGLGIGPPVDNPGTNALAADFPAARELFNKAMPRFKKAMEVYQLDGWVTEHINITLDICNLYRCLAGFEPDGHRQCLMHKQRVKAVEPLMGVLNADFFLGHIRSIDLEAAFAFRDIMEIKDREGREASKVEAAGQAATRYFQRFIASYEQDGLLPDKVPDESEGLLLTACLNLGRVLHRAAPFTGSEKAYQASQLSCRHLRWAADYIRRNNLEDMQPEAQLAVELALLLEEKLKLIQRARDHS